jgi:hypothetical protein
MTGTTAARDQVTSDGARTGWIASVAPADATGILAESYAKQVAKLGRVSELTQIGSLYPDLVAQRLALYPVVDATPSAVPEWARRAVALLAQSIKADPHGHSTGDAPTDAIFTYTRTLVLRPVPIVEADVTALRDAGWSDLDILDVNNIAAYYCYINRVAHGLGLQGEA